MVSSIAFYHGAWTPLQILSLAIHGALILALVMRRSFARALVLGSAAFVVVHAHSAARAYSIIGEC